LYPNQKKILQYIVKVEYGKHGEGSGVIIPLRNQEYSYVITAKHTFGEKEKERGDDYHKIDIKKIEIGKIILSNPYEINLECNGILEVNDIDSKVDLLILKIKNNKDINDLKELKIYNGAFEYCLPYGFPNITKDAHTSYEPFECKYKDIVSDTKFEMRIVDFPNIEENLSTKKALSGLSGSGVYVKVSEKEIGLIGIVIKASLNNNTVCLDLRKILERINKNFKVPIPTVYKSNIKKRLKLKKDDKLYLTIELTEVEKEKTFKMRIWQRVKDKDFLQEVYSDDTEYKKNNITEKIEDFIFDNYKDIPSSNIFILFVLPSNLMSENINLWKFKSGRLFGNKYQVLYRGKERFQNSKRVIEKEYRLTDWKENWESFKSKKKEKLKNQRKAHISSSEQTDIATKLVHDYPCVIMDYIPTKKCFENLYRSAVPIILWANNCTRMEEFQKIFKKGDYKKIRLGQLHEKLYLFQSNITKLDANIMLLYDNPNELPPDKEASQKVQKTIMPPQ